MLTGCEEFINWLENPVSPNLKMSVSPKTMKVGETYTRAAQTYKGAVVSYSSSDETVATVDENGTVSALAEGSTTITASVIDGKAEYTQISYIKESLSYEVTVVPAIDPMLATPLTMEATTAGTIVIKTPKVNMKYKKNNDDLVTISSNDDVTITVAIGDKVAFYGDGTTITSYNGTKISGGSAQVKVYGNVMSLVDETGFADAKTLTTNSAFSNLFLGNSQLANASGLQLPATTLTASCYANMFNGCTSLTTAPKLPATELKDDCYNSMFWGCLSLTTAPKLPATELKLRCYNFMFNSCSSLTTAPELPATTLATGCYWYMFCGCTNLTTAPKLPATTLAPNCYRFMFYGCTSLTKAYVKAAYTNTNNECDNMFTGCTDAATSTFYGDDAANWKTAFAAELGSWATAAYPTAP